MVLRWVSLAILLATCNIASGQSRSDLTANEIIRQTEQTTHDGFEHAAEFDYCLTEHRSDESKTYAAFTLHGSTYLQLVAANGIAISAEDWTKLKPAREVETERRSQETPAQRERRVAQYESEQRRNRTLLHEMTKAFKFTYRGKTEKDGWKTYRLDVAPRNAYRPKDRMTRVLTGMRGSLWIDEQTYGWVRAEATVVQPIMIEGFLARVEKGTRFVMEERPFGKNIWLPTLFSIHTKARILFIFPTSSTQEYIFFNYVPQGTLMPEMCLIEKEPPAPNGIATRRPEHE